MIGWAAATGAVGVEPSCCSSSSSSGRRRISGRWRCSAPTTTPRRRADAAGGRRPAETRLQILLYSIVLAPVGAAPWLLGYAGAVYGLTALCGRRADGRARLARLRREGGERGGARRAAVRLLDPLSVRAVRRAADRADSALRAGLAQGGAWRWMDDPRRIVLTEEQKRRRARGRSRSRSRWARWWCCSTSSRW